MARSMKVITVIACVLGAGFFALQRIIPSGLVLSLAITFSTIAYHFLMRLLVGLIYDKTLNNRVNYNLPWFQLRPFEDKLYARLCVKKWKNRMPTYDPDVFSPKKHSWDEIAQAMCQAELVHETIAVLSFLPLFTAIHWGDLPVFLITSVCAALLDLSFVIIQRYNRPRVLLLIRRRG